MALADPATEAVQISYGYDPYSNGAVSSVDGATARWRHDPINGVRQAVDANGAAITVEYTQIGQVARVTDARGNAVSFAYDDAANLLSRTDPLAAVSRVA